MTGQTPRRMGRYGAIVALVFLLADALQGAEPLVFHARSRAETRPGSGQWRVAESTYRWDPARTAVIVCDMWDRHWCQGATRRVAEMAPRMNEALSALRNRGALIIHCPSGTMDFYRDTPGRELAQAAPAVAPKVPLQNWCSLDPSREAPLPIDDSDGGCDDRPACAQGSPWRRQIRVLQIKEGDAVTDSAEAYYLMQQRGIENLIVMGVHLNMCVLGRPFSIRQMVAQGKNVVLMRDLTDTMYNSRKAPYVSHCAGTDLMVEHVEKYWCASTTSDAFVEGAPFRFQEDQRAKVLFMIGEHEYETRRTLPEFAGKELGWRGLDCEFVHVDERDPNHFPGIEALPRADLLVLSVRRRTPSKAQLALIREHLEQGKPLVALRTSSHAFGADPPDERHERWDTFDVEVLGAKYENHYGRGTATRVRVLPGAAHLDLLNGLQGFRSPSSLYRSRNLAGTVTPLLEGQLEGRPETEPVAWVNTNANRRVFYTSLGGPEDFEEPAFRRLLLNGVLWALDRPIPPDERAIRERAARHASEWQPLEVPGTWEDNAQIQHDGFAWYRCRVEVPADWDTGSLELRIEAVDNAHEAYVNGTRVGGAGSFPPRYQNGLEASGSYAIPRSLIGADRSVFIAIRIYDHEGRGGFKGDAPMLREKKKAIRLAGLWQFRIGADAGWARAEEGAQLPILTVQADGGGAEALKPSAGSSSPPPSGTAGTAGAKPPLSPEEALKKFKVAPDLELDLLLSEPVISQPVFLNFDERGRMWVVEYRQYPHPAGLTMLSHDSVWRAVYDKIPPAPPRHFPGADRISIHEDADGDGTFERHSTFLDGLNIVTAVERGRGGVWVLNPPYLLFYPDANDDDVPDADPVVHLAGFGLEDTHSVANSLRWGPDGWLYGAQGSTVTGNMVRPGLDTEPVARTMGQLIWRYHPESRRFEVFAEGGGNAFGCEIDAQGRVFSGHNGGNTRGFHYMQGAYLQKGFEKHGPLSNPNAFGYFPPMKHPDVERFTHNFIVYEGGSLPPVHAGRLFGVEPLQGRIVESLRLADRSTFRTEDVSYPVTSDDPWFKPVDIKAGPDGAIYLCDWYDLQVNHYRNHEGLIDTNRGRIYRLRARGARSGPPVDLSRIDSGGLVDRLRHENKWIRQTALRLLADRRDATVAPKLASLFRAGDGQTALEALRGLNAVGAVRDLDLLDGLDHADPYVRTFAIQMAGEQARLASPLALKLTALATSEPDVQVRCQLAITARRLDPSNGFPILRNLMRRKEDADDPRLPLLIWWALEARAGTHSDRILDLFSERQLWFEPVVEQHLLERLMRRYAQGGSRRDLAVCVRLFELAPGIDQAERLMSGFQAAFKGRSMAGLPDDLVRAMSRHGGDSLSLGLRRADPASVNRALRVVEDETAPAALRLELTQILAEVKVTGSEPVLLGVIERSKDGALKRAALTAVQQFEDPKIATLVIRLLPVFDAESLPTAQALLASRPAWSLQLLEAIQAGRVDAASLPPHVIEKIRAHGDPRIAGLASKLRAPEAAPREPLTEFDARLKRLEHAINGGVGDPYFGRSLFDAGCAPCHQLFGQGGRIGPDLTYYRRDDLPNFLLAIVKPAAEIREGYEYHILEMEDGRSLGGTLVDQDDRVVVLRGLDGQEIILERKDIASRRMSETSLMPEGLIDPYTDQQLRDLFAYLRSTQPLVGSSTRAGQ